jgi:methionyl-tRNA formyltransferase
MIHTTALDIIHKFQEFGPQLLIDTMVDYATGKVQEVVQPEDGVSHCSKLEKTHGLINPWTQSLHEINNIYRGCYLRPKTYFVLDESWGKHAGKQIIIDTLQLDEIKREANKDLPLLATRDSQLVINDAVTTLLIKPE